jgi:hypothetical protein
MKKTRIPGLEASAKARRDFLKLGAGAGALTMLAGYSDPGFDKAAEPPQASESAGAKDAAIAEAGDFRGCSCTLGPTKF